MLANQVNQAQNMCGYKNQMVCIQYVRTIMVTQFESCILYADPRRRIKTKVYFGLYNSFRVNIVCKFPW